MIDLKTPEEVEKMKKGGKILHRVLLKLLDEAKVGITLKELDRIAKELIIASGGKPSFKMVRGYKWTICACVNDVVVHGIPNGYILQEGDLIGIDCGVYLDGFHTDHAWTKIIGKKKTGDRKQKEKFLAVGRDALDKAVKMAQPGNYIYDISKEIQKTVEGGGYNVVRSLVGHGVGRKLHEDPEIPGFVKDKREATPKLQPGMVLAIEVIYNLGSPDVVYKGNDGWTIASKDGKISGLFEATVAITSRGGIVLT